MKKLIVGGLAALALGLVLAPAAQADVDCYTQTTYDGNTRTTCYSGYPDYHRTVIDCDATHCVTRGDY
jgi:hypothetical protein